MVEAVDKKQNFPGPKRNPLLPQPVQFEPQRPQIAQPNSSGPSNGKNDKGKASEEPVRVMTPELRKLLSRNVEVLPRTTVAQKGDGMPARD